MKNNQTSNNHSWIKDLEYIIWDLDGTLYPSTEELNQKILGNTWKLISEAQSISLEEAKALHQRLYSKLHSHTRTLIAAGVDKKIAMSGSWYNQVQLEAIKPNPSLVESITEADFVKHIVNTNSPQKAAEDKLEKLGFKLSDFRAVIGNPDTVGKQKPDPAPFEYILNLTQAPAEKHLFVGDRYKTDLAPAQKLGMRTALVYDEDDRADLSVNNLDQLLDILD